MLEPEGYKVIVKPEKIEKKTKGGIILPDQTRDMEQRGGIRGEIIAIGPNAEVKFNVDGEPRWAEVGDKVIFARYGGFIIEDNDEEFRILNDSDIIALIL